MANSRKRRQEIKKQKRSATAKERVLSRREKLRKEVKAAREDMKWQKHFRIKMAPIRNNPTPPVDSSSETVLTNEAVMTAQTPIEDVRKVEWAKQKLEHNMKILQAIEEEMQKESAERDAVKASLEKHGAVDLADQYNAAKAFVENHLCDPDKVAVEVELVTDNTTEEHT